MSYYASHVFFCCNQREGLCCHDKGASALRSYAKKKVHDLGLSGPGSYVDETDIDEIVEEHVLHGRVVERLRL